MGGVLLCRERLLGAPKGSPAIGDNMTMAVAEDVRWDLTRLYPAPDAPAVEDDLRLALDEAKAFAARYRGKLDDLAGDELANAVRELEAIQERVQKVGTFAFLHF